LPISIVIISLATVASYSLGPDIRAMSADEYRAMKYVWQNISPSFQEGASGGVAEAPACAIVDTYPLLALEYLSQKQVTGGGFPIGQDFSQPDRVALYDEMKNNPDPSVWSKAETLTNSQDCYFVVNTKDIHYNDYTYKEGEKWKMFGDMIVWPHSL